MECDEFQDNGAPRPVGLLDFALVMFVFFRDVLSHGT